jgi:hypothetical protein
MNMTRRNHASIAVMSISMIVLFALSSAIAGQAGSSDEAGIYPEEGDGQSPMSMDEDDEAAQQQISQASTVPDRCDDVGEKSVVEQSALLVPYELVSLDYFGMVVRYFGDVGC